MYCKITENFTKIEKDLYKKYPKFKKTENDFLLNGKKIDKNKTLEENKIKNDDLLVHQIIDLKINYITIYFTSVE